VTRVTHDSRLLTSHCHCDVCVPEREGSIDAISISYCAYALTLGARADDGSRTVNKLTDFTLYSFIIPRDILAHGKPATAIEVVILTVCKYLFTITLTAWLETSRQLRKRTDFLGKA